jgi:hypothetical protein
MGRPISGLWTVLRCFFLHRFAKPLGCGIQSRQACRHFVAIPQGVALCANACKCICLDPERGCFGPFGYEENIE